MSDEMTTIRIDDCEGQVRFEVLRRLAEQAMSDPAFREIARDDLDGALRLYGYDLNEHEMRLVLRFRAALADAGIDLFLKERMTIEHRDLLQQVLG
jgi:hypothetical protein